MGYIKHHTIVVTGWQDEKLKEAHQKAKEVFEKNFESEPHEKPFASRLVSDIIQGLTNGQGSFFIAPDGSKEGWATSNNGDNARKEFLDWLQKADKYCDYVEVSFGGDDEHERIVRSNYKLLIKMRNQCKCELPYVRSGSDTCTQCNNQNDYFIKKIAEGKEYDKPRYLNKDEHAVGDIHSVWQKPFGCFVKIVELHKDGWVKVQVPSGGYMDTQILGEKVGVEAV